MKLLKWIGVEFPPSTHTPVQPATSVRPQQRSAESSPAALFGEQGSERENRQVGADSVREEQTDPKAGGEKVSKLDVLAGAVGVAGVGAGLGAFIEIRSLLIN